MWVQEGGGAAPHSVPFVRLQDLFLPVIVGGQDDDGDNLDVNGNPTQISLENYQQLRQPLGHKADLAAISAGGSAGQGLDSELVRKRQRKQRRLEKEKQSTTIVSKTDKDFKGDLEVGDLLAFIEGGKKQTVVDIGAKSGKKKKVVNGQSPDCKVAFKKDSVGETPTVGGRRRGMGQAASTPDVAVAPATSTPVSHPNGGEEVEVDEDKKQQSEFYDCLSHPPAEEASEMKKPVVTQKLREPKPLNKKSNTTAATVSNSKGPDSSQISNGSTNNKKLSKVKNNTNKKEKTISASSLQNGSVTPKVNNDTSSMKISELSPIALDNGIDFENGAFDDYGYPIKKEESFTEVKKKKKRSTVKENPPENTYNYHNSHNNSYTNNYHNNPSSTYQQRNGAPYFRNNHYNTRASSPPPSSESKPDDSQNQTQSQPLASTAQDLSPSAFPVLGSHSCNALRSEARRNSCGDIASSDTTDSRVYYDSDHESVKSLPGSKLSDSGHYPTISYARMAAAPRKSNESASPSSESGIVTCSLLSSSETPGSLTDVAALLSPGSNPDPTPSETLPDNPESKERRAAASVWKGSPRERRHSIGSSPETFPVEEKNVIISERTRQKSGSQECLSREASTTSPCPSNVAPVKNILLEAENNSDCSDDKVSESVCEKNKIELVYKENEKENQQIIEITSNSSAEKDLKNDCLAESLVDRGDKSDSESTKSVPPANLSKSVVFLDKRFAKTPKKSLGISFGFDDDESSVLQEPTSQSKTSPSSEQASGDKSSNSVVNIVNKGSSTHQNPDSPSVPSPVCCDNQVPKAAVVLPAAALPISHSNSQVNPPPPPLNHSIIINETGSINLADPHGAAVFTPVNVILPPVPHAPANLLLPTMPPGGVIFSPNHPPPPLPTHITASQLHAVIPSAQIKLTTMPPPDIVLPLSVVASDNKVNSPVASSDVSKENIVTSENDRVLPSNDSVKNAISVVYGLKIKPNGGCGTVLFKPPVKSEKRDKSHRDAPDLLKKKWCDIKEPSSTSTNYVAIKE